MSKILHHYNANHNEASPTVVAPFIIELMNPHSVVDVGCGVGQWLSVLERLGVGTVLGLDGDHVPRDEILIESNKFIAVNLERPQSVGRRFDVAICLEVAEHLPESAADEFINFLCSLSDRIVFSAAIPGQTGENHRNEQPHEYWHDKFLQRGYKAYDVFRPRFWNDNRVNWWYRQNMYLYLCNDGAIANLRSSSAFSAIHPQMMEMLLRDNYRPLPSPNILRRMLRRLRSVLLDQR